jgi:hypothetical protein
MNSTNLHPHIDAEHSDSLTPCKVGFWAALVSFTGAVGFSIVQYMQILAVLSPPWDGILIYGFSLCIAVPFMIAMLALHYVVLPGKKIWSHAAVLFSVMYAVYVNLNYVVQLATVIPMSVRGSLDQIRILDQTPHSLFWDVDALGYISMGLATLFAFPVFAKKGLEMWVRSFFLANGLVVPIIAFVYFYPTFSTPLLMLGSVWIVTALGSISLLTLFFRRKAKGNQKPQ